MVPPSHVRRIVIDAARLVKSGEISVVFGSASLAFWLNAPTSRDVDCWVTPPERGDSVEALMGELRGTHDGGVHASTGASSQMFPSSQDQSSGRRRLQLRQPGDTTSGSRCGFQPSASVDQDQDHVSRILGEAPLDRARLDALVAESPYRTGEEPPGSVAAFETHLAEVRARLRG